MYKTKKHIIFLIYLVQFIFVIIIIAVKGINLNYKYIFSEEKAEYKTILDKSRSDSLKAIIDSLRKSGIDPVIIYKVFMPDAVEWINLPSELSVFERHEGGFIIRLLEEVKPLSSPTQFTYNNIRNNSEESLKVYTDNNLVLVLSPNSEGGYKLKGEKSVRYVFGENQIYLKTLKKKTQKIIIETTDINNSKKSMEGIQSNFCCRVTIESDFLEQIQVKAYGPFYLIKVKDGVYDVIRRANGTLIIKATDVVSGETVSKQMDFNY